MFISIQFQAGRGDSIMVSVCKAGRLGLSPAQSVCYRNMEIYLHVINLFPPVLMTHSTKVVHVLSCLCDNSCKRSPAICCKNRVLCNVARLLSVPISSTCAEQGH